LVDFVDKNTVETKKRSLERAGFTKTQGPPSLPDASLPDVGLVSGRSAGASPLKQWYVDNVFEKYALHLAPREIIMSANAAQVSHGWTFSVCNFIVDLSEDMQAWRTAPTLTGINHSLRAPAEDCENVATETDEVLVKDTNSHVSDQLRRSELGRLASLNPEDTVSLLRINLQWRVVRVRHCYLRVDENRRKYFRIAA